ncbi:hypothetical protein QBC47DRAFT_430876 [Echria macrotheca]|uniref:Uncharacterized protein n=1 Tax=Echria macrotheca TaxID=438768 RepID=A0AAJ0B6X9_9PEZI|nr:hypothetical protein QBC47DRAFT_430876 [Echria macrotheca]
MLDSQFNPGFANNYKAQGDLSWRQKLLGDHVLTQYYDAMGIVKIPIPEDRDALWKLVFRGWNTRSIIPKPPKKPRKRSAEESMTHIGTWKVNLLPTTPSKRTRTGDSPSPHRLIGASAYMKPSLNVEAQQITFMVCDEIGGLARLQDVQLHPGWTMQQAKAATINHWDSSEIERISKYNTDRLVYFVRQLLLDDMRRTEKAEAGEYVLEGQLFHRLCLCDDVMQEMLLVLRETEQIQAQQKAKRPVLAQMVPPGL